MPQSDLGPRQRTLGSYQGTTSVVPHRVKNNLGFSPCFYGFLSRGQAPYQSFGQVTRSRQEEIKKHG